MHIAFIPLSSQKILTQIIISQAPSIILLQFWHQMCGFFPHIEQFCNTGCVSYNVTQFRHYLPGDSLRSRRLRAQSRKYPHLPPTADTSHKSGLLLCSWPTGYKLEVPTNPSSDSINLLEQLTELRKISGSLGFQFIIKQCNPGTARRRDA